MRRGSGHGWSVVIFLLALLFGRDFALDTMGVVAVIGVMTITAFTVGQIILDRRP